MAGTRMRWTELEWYEVAREAAAIREKQGVGWTPAAVTAQKRVLAKSRRRPESSLNGSARNAVAEYAERIAKGWAPEGAGLPTPTPAPTPSIDTTPVGHAARKAAQAPSEAATPRNAGKIADDALEASFTAPGRVHWNTREWALVAAAVEHRQNMGDDRSLARIVFETQASVLPLDRCRRLTGLYASEPLHAGYQAGLKAAGTLSARDRAMCQGRLADYDAAQAKARAGLPVMPPAPPAPPPTETPAPNPAPLPEPATHAAPAPMLSFPAAAPGDPLAARVAMILGNAAAQISAATRQHVLAEYDRQLDRMTDALAATLRQYVRSLVEAELGPLSAPTDAPPPPAAPPAESIKIEEAPAAPPAPEPAKAAAVAEEDAPLPGEKPPARLLVHIVGQPGAGRGMIRETARALNMDAEFIDPERALRHWLPARHVVMAVKDGRLRRVAQAANAQIYFATAGTASIVGMLQSIADHGQGSMLQ